MEIYRIRITKIITRSYTRPYKFPLKYKLQSNHRAIFQTHGLIEDINVAISISIQVDLVPRY